MIWLLAIPFVLCWLAVTVYEIDHTAYSHDWEDYLFAALMGLTKTMVAPFAILLVPFFIVGYTGKFILAHKRLFPRIRIEFPDKHV